MFQRFQRAFQWTLVIVLCVVAYGTGGFAADGGVQFASEHMRLTAHFSDQAVRIVLSDGTEIDLPQVKAASGAKYAKDTTVFWTKGDAASFEWGGASFNLGVVNPLVDPWEKARQAGASFRGIGQEPGWLVEIWEGDRVELTLDYGDTKIKTPLGSVEINYLTGTRTYQTGRPTSPLLLTVVIQDRVCHDTMSGEGFTATVSVLLGASGHRYFGCGRYL